jgi:FdhE protein
MAVASARADLAGRARQPVEWRAWVGVLDVVNAETRAGTWRAFVPEPAGTGSEESPLLSGATFTVGAQVVRRWLRRLLRTAAGAGGPAVTLAKVGGTATEQLTALLEAGLARDVARVAELASSLDVDGGALGAVAAVAPVPLLRGCAERWSAHVSPTWAHGWCPVCSAWPTLAEARGLERARRLRCGRCGADWQTAWLRCVYCSADDHARLGSLVLTTEASDPAGSGLARVATSIDTCEVCRGYLKTVTTLTPTPVDDLALLDLATVELDVAALEHGYGRPPAAGVVVDARVVTSAGRLGGWWRP